MEKPINAVECMGHGTSEDGTDYVGYLLTDGTIHFYNEETGEDVTEDD